MAKMKDMATLNSAIESTTVPANYSNVQKLLSSVVAATTALNSLPSEYSRAYAQVQLLKYDENNNPVDVTPVEALSIPDSVIARYKQSWANIKSNIEALNSLLTDQAQNLDVVDSMSGFLSSDVPISDIAGMGLSTFISTKLRGHLQQELETLCIKLFGSAQVGNLYGTAVQGNLQEINAALLSSPIICKDGLGNVFTSSVSFQFDSTHITAMTLRVGSQFMQIGGLALTYEQAKGLTVSELVGQYIKTSPSQDPIFSNSYTSSAVTDGISSAAGVWQINTKPRESEAEVRVSSRQYVNSTVFESINLQPLESALSGL